jgi:hypothetical protein
LEYYFAANINIVVCEDDKKCNLLLDRPPKCLKRLIAMKEVRPATNQRAKNRGIEIIKFDEVERMGAAQDNKEVVSFNKIRPILRALGELAVALALWRHIILPCLLVNFYAEL